MMPARRHALCSADEIVLTTGTASGGYGINAAGNSFSRDNQRGADNQPGADIEDDEDRAGYKTGTSTPGYRQEGGMLQIPP